MYFSIISIIAAMVLLKIQYIQDFLRGNRELKLFFFTGFLGVTVYFNRFFIRLLDYFVNIGIITDMRIIDHKKSLFFKDTLDSIDMAHIQNIEKIEDGFLPSLLKFGDIKIFLSASDSIKTFQHVPNAKFHFRYINRQKEIRQLALQTTNTTDRNQGELNTENKPFTPIEHPTENFTKKPFAQIS
ncbi:hypothetical protein HZC20_02310 [Candidatus Peregrinibacteria bacterium]|nr:hypothetical protein [Candidatus Peregrinibacteria bacterium]